MIQGNLDSSARAESISKDLLYHNWPERYLDSDNKELVLTEFNSMFAAAQSVSLIEILYDNSERNGNVLDLETKVSGIFKKAANEAGMKFIKPDPGTGDKKPQSFAGPIAVKHLENLSQALFQDPNAISQAFQELTMSDLNYVIGMLVGHEDDSPSKLTPKAIAEAIPEGDYFKNILTVDKIDEMLAQDDSRRPDQQRCNMVLAGVMMFQATWAAGQLHRATSEDHALWRLNPITNSINKSPLAPYPEAVRQMHQLGLVMPGVHPRAAAGLFFLKDIYEAKKAMGLVD